MNQKNNKNTTKVEKFYNLSNDHLFKLIFSDSRYLKKLLSSFFNIDTTNKKIEYLNTELLKGNKLEKIGIVDMLIGIKNNDDIEEIILLELQNIDRHNFKDRLEFYASRIKSRYCLDSSDDYSQMKKMKTLAIMNYDLGYKNTVNNVNLTIEDDEEYKIFNEKFGYKIFNLSKERKQSSDLVKLFKKKDIKYLEKNIKDGICMEILDMMKKYNEDEVERMRMDDIVELMRNETEHYEVAYKDGVNDGINKGIKQGVEKNRKDVAKKLLKNNIDMNTIMLASSLTEKQILALK